MPRRFFQASFGLAIGLATRLLLPGHHSLSWVVAGALSVAGALGAGLAAEHFLPSDTVRRAGFAVSALGAIAMLLIYSVAVQ